MPRSERSNFFLEFRILFNFVLSQHLAKVIPHLGNLLIPRCWILRHRSIDNRLKLSRTRRRPRFAKGIGLLVEYCITHTGRRLSIEWLFTDEQFVKQKAGGKDVRWRIGRQALGLFRCGIGSSTVWFAKFGEMLCLRIADVYRILVEEFRQSEVEYLGFAVPGHHYIVGLNVTMNDVLRVGCSQCITYLDLDRDGAF